MATKIKVAIAGINGRMGRASASAIASDPELELVGAFGRAGADYVGKEVAELACFSSHTSNPKRITVQNGVSECIAATKPDVLLDFSVAESAVGHARYALEHGVRPVIGVSGIDSKTVEELSVLAATKKIGAMVVPNFSLGAVLMMEFARQAGKHFSNVEIVEIHDTRKLDAPSGTSMHTASKLALENKVYNPSEVDERELLQGARGATATSGVRIHSLRLPGLISHQDVIFGSDGELLLIRHDSFNTNCFIKGILMSVRAVINMATLTVGLQGLL